MNQLKSETNVIFGTGSVGLTVMSLLIARGRSVTMVNRSGKIEEPLPANVGLIAGDATNPDFVAAISASADVVFHCAQPPYHKWPEQFPPITKGILKGVTRSGARLIFADNLYMYGPTDGRELTEDLPYAASGRKGKTRSQMAKMLLAAHNAGEIRVAIGRASDFYGPGVRDSVVGEMFFVPALEGKSVNVIGDPDMPHTYTYICDFARALVTLSEHEEAYGRAWHVPSAPTISTRQFADLTAAEIGRPVNLRPGGRLSLTLIGLFVPEVREMKELLYEFEEPFVVNHKQYATSFGNGSTPHDQAIRETTAWFQQRGYSKDH